MTFAPENIAVFFPAHQEAVAIRLARCIHQYLGDLLPELHAQLTYREIFEAARGNGSTRLNLLFLVAWQNATHSCVFADDATFREIVEAVCEQECAVGRRTAVNAIPEAQPNCPSPPNSPHKTRNTQHMH